MRHIVTGGKLSEDGSLKASQNVIQETLKHESIKSLLGLKKSEKCLGTPSLMDYVKVNGKRKVKFSKPLDDHLLLGIPDESMRTCSKIETSNGPLFRQRGFYILDQNSLKLGILLQVYKSKYGVSYAVIEELLDVTAEKGDPFIVEAKAKVLKRTGSLFLLTELPKLHALPILHACPAEDVPSCGFVTGLTEVTEERQLTQQRKTVYNCLGNEGNFFVINLTALSVPTGVGLGCC